MKGKNKEHKTKNKNLDPRSCCSYVPVVSFHSKQCVVDMYLKVALRISELESTDNLSSPYNITLSIRAFERFGKVFSISW